MMAELIVPRPPPSPNNKSVSLTCLSSFLLPPTLQALPRAIHHLNKPFSSGRMLGDRHVVQSGTEELWHGKKVNCKPPSISHLPSSHHILPAPPYPPFISMPTRLTCLGWSFGILSADLRNQIFPFPFLRSSRHVPERCTPSNPIGLPIAPQPAVPPPSLSQFPLDSFANSNTTSNY